MNGFPDALDGPVNTFNSARIDHKDREPEALDGAHDIEVVEIADGQHKIGFQGDNFFQRRTDDCAYTGLLYRFGWVLGEIGHAGNIIASPKRIDGIGNAWSQAN